MPFIFIILNSRRKYLGIVLLLAICVLVNVLLNAISPIFPMLDKIYRMLCFRYLFLAAIAWIWLHKDNYNRYVIYSLAILSLGYLLYVMNDYDPSPLVYEGNWSSQNYPAYFWTYIIILSLWYVYGKIRIDKLKIYFCWMGKNSWHIFIIQMFILGFIRFEAFNIFPNQVINQIIFVLMGLILTLLPIFASQYIKSKYTTEKFSNKQDYLIK